MTTTTPRVYVACLASYNAGDLHGAWIDADQDPDDLLVEIQEKVLNTSPQQGAEEWAIHDYDDFDSLDLGERPSLDKISFHGRMLTKHGNPWAAYVGNIGEEYADERGFKDAYVGEYGSEMDYTKEHIDTLRFLDNAPSECRVYFNYTSYSQDLFTQEYWSAEAGGGKVYVFRNL